MSSFESEFGVPFWALVGTIGFAFLLGYCAVSNFTARLEEESYRFWIVGIAAFFGLCHFGAQL